MTMCEWRSESTRTEIHQGRPYRRPERPLHERISPKAFQQRRDGAPEICRRRCLAAHRGNSIPSNIDTSKPCAVLPAELDDLERKPCHVKKPSMPARFRPTSRAGAERRLPAWRASVSSGISSAFTGNAFHPAVAREAGPRWPARTFGLPAGSQGDVDECFRRASAVSTGPQQ